jgi:large subunit ribosomal protein L18
MSRLAQKQANAHRRANRVAAKIHGTAERPRLAVHISNLHVSAQLINDVTGATIVSASSVGKKLTGTMTEKSAAIGKDIAAKAKKAKVTQIVFDRSDRKYHGRVKALAEAVRAEGMEF